MNFIIMVLQCLLISIGVLIILTFPFPYIISCGVFIILLNCVMLLVVTIPAIIKEMHVQR